MESKVIRLNEDEITAITRALYGSISSCEEGLKAEQNISDSDSGKWIDYYNFQIKTLKKIIEKLH